MSDAELAEELLADPRAPPRREGRVGVDALAALFAARGDGVKNALREIARSEIGHPRRAFFISVEAP